MLISQPRINGNIVPSRTFMDRQQTNSFLLILSSEPNTPLGIVTQVNVTATLASHNAEVKKLVVFSLTVTTDQKTLSKDKESGEKSREKDDEMKIWQILLITLAILFITFLVILGVSRRYCRGRGPKTTQSTMQMSTLNDVIANTKT